MSETSEVDVFEADLLLLLDEAVDFSYVDNEHNKGAGVVATGAGCHRELNDLAKAGKLVVERLGSAEVLNVFDEKFNLSQKR